MSLSKIIGLSAALHLYLGLRLAPSLPLPAGIALAVLLLASAVLVPAALLARRLLRSVAAADRLTWVGMLFMGLFSSLFVLTVLRDVLLLALHLAGRTGWNEPTAAAVPLLALAFTAVGFFNARRPARVKRVDISLPGLPAALAGFRIVQISDIHVGPTIKQGYLQAIVERVNALHPDVIAITGDLVDGSVAELRAHVAPLAALRARHGVFFVTGNHEYYSGVHGWVDELRRLQIRVLHNEHVVIHHEGADLVLAGVPDFSGHHFDPAHRSDPAAALGGAPQGLLRVLLAHQPRTAAAAAEAGFDLQISGHTHGGQFLPWNWFVPLQQPFTAGLHQLGRLQVYVSRGTGYWGPPKRLGAPSEISELRLAPSA
ncbi:metallophosphoesterase [Ramlibacter sp.]|uniref:metallophosphoesterase n=1 Tax=Ramlibacter sp. TaxID=1917967 RepID=UPI002633BD99|nr:metallophosphoesterase [Ramlibacter sp.]MDB5958020.1 serine/threonine protein phosphatase [Ramlibacter sp.]